MAQVDILAVAKETLLNEINGLKDGLASLDNSFIRAVELIQAQVPPGRVIVTGMGKSGHIANKIAATLASTGTPAFYVHPGEAGHGDLGMITPKDIVLALSQSGNSDELQKLIPYFKRHGIQVIALTGGLTSSLAEFATEVISTAVGSEACPLGLAPTTSTTLALALGDALAVSLLQLKGFSKEDFAHTHPQGALGRKLLIRVADVMSKGDKAPIVSSQGTVRELLEPMSEGNLGFLVMVDEAHKAIGVFSDGDLRRCLDKDLDIKSLMMADVMIREFSTVPESMLASEALDLMEQKKINALPVQDKSGKVVGVMNMQQLLQAGIM